MNCMRKTWLRAVVVVVGVVLSGCAGMGGADSERTCSGHRCICAGPMRPRTRPLYQAISYANAATKGPAIIVLPGEVKSNNATFSQRYGPNNIADYAELELSQANFQVLDRANLGSVLREIELAYNLGDPTKAQALFQKGELCKIRAGSSNSTSSALRKSPKRVVASLLARSAASPVPSWAGRTGSVVSQGASSVQTTQDAGVWIVGMRYKIIDARTTQQVAQGYAEDKLEVGATGVRRFSGCRHGRRVARHWTHLVIKLVQKNVVDIDQKYK